MKQLIRDLKAAMRDKSLSPEQAAQRIGCSGNQVRRWIAGTSKPTPLYREALRTGIERINREAI